MKKSLESKFCLFLICLMGTALLLRCTPKFDNPLDAENPNRLLPPQAPSGLLVEKVSKFEIDLSWANGSGEMVGIVIQRRKPNVPFFTVDSILGEQTIYSDTGLEPKTLYHYRVFAYNLGGASGFSNEDSVETDADTTIFLIFESPKDSEIVNSDDITLTGMLTSVFPVDVFQIDGDNVPFNGQGKWTRAVDLDSATNWFFFLVFDNQGNTLRDTLTVFYDSTAMDTIPPFLTISQPQDGDTVSAAQISVQGTASDVSGILIVTIFVNGTLASSNAGTDSWSSDVALITGENIIEVKAIDNAFNSSKDTVRVIYDPTVKDKTSPTLTIDSPKDGDKIGISTVLVSGTASDNGGISSIMVNGQKALMPEPPNWSVQVSLILGSNKLTVIALDFAQNSVEDSIRVVYDSTEVDTTAPNVEITDPTNNTVVSIPKVTISGNATDAGSGISWVMVGDSSAPYNPETGTWTVTIPLMQYGGNKIRAIASDGQGNLDTTAFITIIYDSTAQDSIDPIISPFRPQEGETVISESVLIEVNATDNNGIEWVTIAGDTAIKNSQGQYERTVTLNLGDNAIFVVTQDGSANNNQDTMTLNLIFDPTAEDKTKPDVTLFSPKSGEIVTISPVLVQVTAIDESGIKSVTINGVSAILNGAYYELSVSLSSSPHPITVVAVDSSTNANTRTSNFSIIYNPTALDSTPPNIQLITPDTTKTATTPGVTVQVTATDSNGILSVTIGGINAAPTVGNNYQADLNLKPGNNTIDVIATDSSLSKNKDTLTFSLFYDVPPNSVTLSLPTNIKYSSMDLTWSMSDAADFKEYRLYFAYSAGVSISSINGGPKTNITDTTKFFAGLNSNTTVYFKIFVFDSAGGSSESNEVSATTLDSAYVRDSLAVRAILDSNGLDTTSVKAVTSGVGGGRITNLKLHYKQLTTLPAAIGQLTSLTVLFLQYNKLTTLPTEIEQLTSLKILNLSNNQLTAVPAEIGQLINLTSLDLWNNQLTTLPAEIGQLINLKTLFFPNNQFTFLPAEIENLTPTNLSIGNNYLCLVSSSQSIWLNTYDSDWGDTQNCVDLWKLDSLTVQGIIDANGLTTSFDAFTDSSGGRVTVVNFRNQGLKEIPASIGNLTGLIALYLENNQLAALPATIVGLGPLSSFSVVNNFLCDIPVGDSIRTWLDTNQATWEAGQTCP